MPRYILTRFTTPVSESFSTLDDALAACLKEDGRYIVQAFAGYGESLGQYSLTVTDSVATLAFKHNPEA
jgi:hypothetical protein